MGYRRSEDRSNLVVGVLGYLLGVPCGAIIKAIFAKNANRISFYGIYWASLIVLYCLYRLLMKYKKQRDIRNALCHHGVKGGQTLNLCAACVREAEEQKKRREEEFERERRKSEIKAKVLTLKNQELARLTKIRLKHEENLLSLSPSDFEDAVAVLYRNLGYSVEQTPYSGDFGKDIVAVKEGGKVPYRMQKVST